MTGSHLGGQLLGAFLADSADARDATITLAGRSVVVEVAPKGTGFELRCVLPWATTPDAVALRALEDQGLTEPGDIAITWSAGQLVATCTVIDLDPSRLRLAVYGVAKAALRAQRLFIAVGPQRTVRDAQPPDLSRVEAALRGLEASAPSVLVPATQPAWTTPDPSSKPVAQLEPGTSYTLVSRSGDWAELLLKGGRKVFTDGRSLREAR